MHCAKMLRITWEMDVKHQQKSIYTFGNASV